MVLASLSMYATENPDSEDFLNTQLSDALARIQDEPPDIQIASFAGHPFYQSRNASRVLDLVYDCARASCEVDGLGKWELRPTDAVLDEYGPLSRWGFILSDYCHNIEGSTNSDLAGPGVGTQLPTIYLASMLID